VAVRSIENADKNGGKIDKWIEDINELHRSKPPPQVHYKTNMPEMEVLLDQVLALLLFF
jgi:intraflagellar transport protein 46